MVDLYLPITYVLTAVLSYVTSLPAPNDAMKANHASLVQHLDTVNHHLQALSRSIRSAHTDITARQLEECEVLGSRSRSSICDLIRLDMDLESREQTGSVLHNTLVPSKQTDNTYQEETEQRKILLQDLIRKRDLLQKLRSIIDSAKDDVKVARKRTCNLNLGFHCQTEQYSAITDMYHWLNNPLSPGKRRK